MTNDLLRALRMMVGVARLESAWITRQPMWIIQDIFMVISLSIILWAWGGVRGVSYVITGYIVATAFGLGVNIVGQSMGWSRVIKTLELYIASPITPRIFIVATTLSGAVFLVTSFTLFLVLGLLLGQVKLVIYSFTSALLLTPLSVLLGLIIAFYVKKPGNISAITNPVVSILTLLPPVLYPVSVLPEPLRHIAVIIPTVTAAELARTLGGVETVYNPVLLAVILLTWTLIAFIIANRVVKWSLE